VNLEEPCLKKVDTRRGFKALTLCRTQQALRLGEGEGSSLRRVELGWIRQRSYVANEEAFALGLVER
jgi:hypothetical protein